MSTYVGPFSGKDKRALTRSDVEKRLRRVGDSRQLDLSRENLSRCDLKNMNLIGSNLSQSDLRGANLTGADLSEANLSEANLSEANLSEVNLSHASLGYADLSGAYLTGANLRGAYLDHAKFRLAGLSYVDLSGANLKEADLSGANLKEANLMGAYLSKSNLSRANLTGANLSEADLSKADLSKADLSGAKLSGIILSGTDFSKDELIGVGLSELRWREVTLGLAGQSNARMRELEQLRAALIEHETSQSAVFPKKTVQLVSSLRLRIVDEPLTVQHLAKTLDTLIVLYVKLWLLDQHRFDDFERYSHVRDRNLEAEVPLPIAELTYNSPANIKVNIDFSPKGVIEALQTLIDTIIHARIRKKGAEATLQSTQLENQLKAEKLKQERLATIELAFGTLEQGIMLVDKLSPGLSKKQKELALQSLAKEILSLASDSTVEISLVPPQVAAPGTKKVFPSPSTAASIQKTP